MSASSHIQNVAVLGGGTMGNGIAHVFAQNGFNVTLVDTTDDFLKRAVATITGNLDRQVKKAVISEAEKAATLSRLKTSTITTDVAGCELVIEAVFENLEVKRDLLGKVDRVLGPKAIIASNTSSLPITLLGSATGRPDRFVGMHFMNPVPVMKLVEVIRGYSTTDAITKTVFDLSKQLGKVPVEVNDYPGFVANRILMPMINEAVISLHEGVAGVEEIDTVMKLGMAHPMGPLQLADFIGLDVCLSIMRVLHDGLGNSKYAPCPLLVNMVVSGNLGVKSGSGFYKYTAGSKELVVADNFRKG